MTIERDDLQKLAYGTLLLIQEFKKVQDMRTDLDRITFEILMQLKVRGQLRPSDIAEELQFNPSSVTRRIQTLEAAGQVAVTTDPADQRSSLIRITPDGDDQLTLFLERSIEGLAGILKDWSGEDVQGLASMLLRYGETMKHWRQSRTQAVQAEKTKRGRVSK